MENHLKEINAVLGVVGSFVCLPDGSIAGKVMPEAFDAASLGAAARVLTQTLNALETSGQRVVETDLVYGQRRLLLKNLRGGILTIVCARSINIPLLNLTANGIAKKIASELKPTKPVSTTAIPSNGANKAAELDVTTEPVRPAEAEAIDASTAPTEQIQPAEVGEMTIPTESVRPIQLGATGVSIDLNTNLNVMAEGIQSVPAEVRVGIAASPSELADDRFFLELTRELTRVMGPISSIIVEDEIDALKEKREAFPKSRAAELVARVSLSIHDEGKRAKFLQAMSTITQRP